MVFEEGGASPLVEAPEIRVVGLEALDWVRDVHDRFYVQTGTYTSRFNEYVARSVESFQDRFDPSRDRLWQAGPEGRTVGGIGVCHRDDELAQLRYLYVDEAARGHGLGHRLVCDALDFAAGAGYSGVMLWTMQGLDAAASVYRRAGFERTRVTPAPWHKTRHQERWELEF